jgi:putative ABC transport system permease protein
MLRTTLKNLMAHKLRLALTALSVVLGVGFVAGTFVLTDTMSRTFDNLFADVTKGVDVYVRSESSFEAQIGGSRKPIPDDLLERIREVDGVAVASGSVDGYAQFVDQDGKAVTPNGAPTLGVNWVPEPLTPLTLRDGSAPTDPDEVVVDAGTAGDHRFQVGDRIKVLTQAGSREFTVSGIAGFGDADNLAGATLASFETETAQELFDRKGQFASIEVAAEDGVSTADLQTRIEEVLPQGTEASSGASVAREQAQSIQQGLGFFNTALLVFAGIALFVGAFIIYNTFSITVAQRMREFGILRALGASGGQIMASVLLEALLVGLIASVVGLGLGVAIALLLQVLLATFGIELPSTTLQLLPRTVVVSLVVGTVVTLVSSVLPARKAARVTPMEALRDAQPTGARWSARRTVTGLLLTVVGAGILLFGLFGNSSQGLSLVGLGAFTTFIGVSVLTPLFASPLARLIGTPFGRMMHLPGKLAQQNAARNPRRTASTAAALMIGLALVGLVGIFAASLKASTNKIVDESLKADFMISNASIAAPPAISPRLAADVAELESVRSVASLRQAQFRDDQKRSLFLAATDPATFDDVADLEVTEGSIEALSDGGVLLFAPTAEDLGLSVGEDLEMRFAATGSRDVPVAGLFENKSMVNSDYIISVDTYDEVFTERVDSAVLVAKSPDASPAEARTEIEKVTDRYPNVELRDQTEIKERSAADVDQLLGLVTALLGLALVIALLGITNTLALSVFERTRELGLLRAVGMARKQTRSMIRWEAVIISLFGALLGITVGIFFGWAFVSALNDQGITEFAVPFGQLVIYVLFAGLAGIVAAIPPARRAARLNVLEAIATE